MSKEPSDTKLTRALARLGLGRALRGRSDSSLARLLDRLAHKRTIGGGTIAHPWAWRVPLALLAVAGFCTWYGAAATGIYALAAPALTSALGALALGTLLERDRSEAQDEGGNLLRYTGFLVLVGAACAGWSLWYHGREWRPMVITVPATLLAFPVLPILSIGLGLAARHAGEALWPPLACGFTLAFLLRLDCTGGGRLEPWLARALLIEAVAGVAVALACFCARAAAGKTRSPRYDLDRRNRCVGLTVILGALPMAVASLRMLAD